MALQDQLNQFYQQIPSVPVDKNYWLVRTHAGKQYGTFKSHGCIGLGYEKIPIEQLNGINALGLPEKQAVKLIKQLVIRYYSEENRPALIAHHLYWFHFKMKEGDVVIIPSKGSRVVSIGVVSSTEITTRSSYLSSSCLYRTTKKIEWQKELRRIDLEPALARMLFSHNRITHLTKKYGTLIEAVYSNFFVKEGIATSVLGIESKEAVNARELFEMGHHLLYVTGEFAKSNGLYVDFNDVSVKVNLNTTSTNNTTSNLKFSSSIGNGALILAVLSVFLDSEGVRYTSENIAFASGGRKIIDAILSYKDNLLEDRIGRSILESFHSMQVKPPVDAVELIRKFSVVSERVGE